MPSLPLIPLDTPVEKPAEAAVTYDAIWINQFLTIAQPSDSVTGGGKLIAEIWPMTSDGTGRTLGGGNTIRIETDHLFQCVAEVPEAAQALGAILLALPKVAAWEKARRAAEEAARENGV